MPQTGSIITDNEWRRIFGELVSEIANYQKLDPNKIARRLNRMEGGDRSRLSDWSRYRAGKRIPSPPQLAELATALRMPHVVLQVCAGYVDAIFRSVYDVAIRDVQRAKFSNQRATRRGAFALLFSLFPTTQMHVGGRCSLLDFLGGHVVGLNLTRRGVLTGEDWNATWLFPSSLSTKLLIANRPPVTVSIPSGSVEKSKTHTYYSVRALGQVDVGSRLAKVIVLSGPRTIPKSSILYEALHLMHIRKAPVEMRVRLATELVHLWADELDHEMAEAVRFSLHPWRERTLTTEAVEWIKGRRKREPDEIWA